MGKPRKGKVAAGEDPDQSFSLRMDRLWRPVFDQYDEDHDGRVPLDDLKRQIHEGNGHLGEELPREVINEILERADWDKNRVITFDEFVNMIYARELGSQRPRFQQLIRYAAMAVVPQNQRQTTVRRYIEAYNCVPPPLFLVLISIVEVAVFIYYCVELNEASGQLELYSVANTNDSYVQISATGPVPFDSVMIYNPRKRYEAWRFLSYALIHAGFFHLFFNVLIQLALGIPLEMVHKWWRVGLVYLGGVIAGSLGASISDPYSYLAGASGGVYALIAGHLANVVINWSEMEFNWIRLIGLIVFGGTDVGVAIYDRYTRKEVRTSYAAHFAGAIAGLLLGLVFLRNLRRHRWEIALGYVALVLYVLLMGSAIVWNFAFPSYFPVQYEQEFNSKHDHHNG